MASLKHTKVDDVEGTVKNALKLFDHDGGSMVTVSELSTVLSRLGDKMSKDDIDEIFRQAEVRTEFATFPNPPGYSCLPLSPDASTHPAFLAPRRFQVDSFGQISIEDFAILMRRATGEEDNAFA